MDNQPAYSFLLGLRALREQLADYSEELARLRASATSTTTQLTGMSVSGTRDPHKDGVVIALADHDDRAVRMKERLWQETLLAKSLVIEVEDPTQQRILTLRYLNGLKWRQVQKALAVLGTELGMSTLYKYHNAALDAAETVWEQGLYDNRYREIKTRHPLA